MLWRLQWMVLIGAGSLLAAVSAQAENWPGWRGPRGDGTSLEGNVPIQWNGARPGVRRVPPKLGEHDADVLTWLGYTLDDIRALRERGVLSGATRGRPDPPTAHAG